MRIFTYFIMEDAFQVRPVGLEQVEPFIRVVDRLLQRPANTFYFILMARKVCQG
jgi:hypothetical protein